MLNRDPLVSLAICRAALIANKTHDFAAEHPEVRWPEVTHWSGRSLATGEPVEALSRGDFNARRQAFEHSHTYLPRYKLARLRAMRPVSGLAMADMRAMAARCVNATERAVAAMRNAA